MRPRIDDDPSSENEVSPQPRPCQIERPRRRDWKRGRIQQNRTGANRHRERDRGASGKEPGDRSNDHSSDLSNDLRATPFRYSDRVLRPAPAEPFGAAPLLRLRERRGTRRAARERGRAHRRERGWPTVARPAGRSQGRRGDALRFPRSADQSGPLKGTVKGPKSSETSLSVLSADPR